MVVPEVDHDFFKLARAVDRARNARLGRFERNGGEPGAPALLCPFVLVAHLLSQFGELAGDVAGAGVGGVEGSQALGQRGRIGQALRLELGVDIALHTGLRDPFDIARLGAERGPVQHVGRLLLGAERARTGAGRCRQTGERGQQHADGGGGGW